MDPFLVWIENGDLSVWLRESDLGFATALSFHIVSVALVAGVALPMALRLLGALSGVPADALARLRPIFWIGLAVSVASGLLLVAAYPTKSLTNPLFYAKMLAIGLALVVLRLDRKAVAQGGGVAAGPKGLGYASLGLWVFIVAAGRLLAYTYLRLMVSF